MRAIPMSGAASVLRPERSGQRGLRRDENERATQRSNLGAASRREARSLRSRARRVDMDVARA
jgi:hypothetical protein